MQLHESLGDRQAKTGALAPARVAGIDLAERRQRDRDLFCVMPTPVSRTRIEAPPSASAAAPRQCTEPPGGVNFMALLIRL